MTSTPNRPSSPTASSGCTRWTVHPDSVRRAGCRATPSAPTSAAPTWFATGPVTGWCSKTTCASPRAPPMRSRTGGCSPSTCPSFSGPPSSATWTRCRRCCWRPCVSRRRRGPPTNRRWRWCALPADIDYYLGEKPALAQVPTWICAERAQRDYVLDNIAELVVKPIDGHGGTGVVIGPEAAADALEVRRRELQSQPERYIAQEAIALSTHPTFDGEGMYPHHVDLRAFVQLRARSDRT